MRCWQSGLVGLVLASGLVSCGSDKKDDPTPTPTSADFTAVNTILEAHCATSGCHGTGSTYGVFVGNSANLIAKKAEVISRVTVIKDMPPTTATAAQKAISDANRTALKDYVSK